MNVLVVCAHHDDLEVGCGGTVARLIDAGHAVTSLVMTHSGYQAPDGTPVRSKDAALREARRAADTLGYELVSHDEDTFDIVENDANVCKILTVIERRGIDTVLTHWHGDPHPPHQRVHRMALHASRHLPRAFGFAVNWYVSAVPFVPHLFVAISDAQWQRRLSALRCYEGEFQRTGERWVGYLDNQTRNYGTQIGVERAEAFTVYKHLWDIGEGSSDERE